MDKMRYIMRKRIKEVEMIYSKGMVLNLRDVHDEIELENKIDSLFTIVKGMAHEPALGEGVEREVPLDYNPDYAMPENPLYDNYSENSTP